MYSLCISGFKIDTTVMAASATASLRRVAVVSEEADPYDATRKWLCVAVQDCPELTSAFDRNGPAAVLQASSNSPNRSLPATASRKSFRRSMPATPGAASPIVVSRVHPRIQSLGSKGCGFGLKLRWTSESILAVYCRHDSGRWSGLTVIGLVEHEMSMNTDVPANHPAQEGWSSPSTSEMCGDGRAWVTHVTPAMLRRMLFGTKQGLLLPADDTEAAEILHKADVRDALDANVQQRLTDTDMSTEEEESILVNGIWGVEEDVGRGGLWVQLDAVIASLRLFHLGNGLFSYEVCQRVPLNNNLLTAELGYRTPKWASSQRLMFVLDEEYQEIKAWSIHGASAICLLNIPLTTGAPVEALFCSEDGSLLFVVHTNGLRVISTHHLGDVLAPPTTSRRTLGDCARLFCGEGEHNGTRIAWDAVGRNASAAKQALLRGEPPHELPGIAPRSIRRVAFVEGSIAVVCHSGAAILLTPYGVVKDARNVLDDPAASEEPDATAEGKTTPEKGQQHQRALRKGVVLHVARPPLPQHVVELVLYPSTSPHAGCRAWFASTSINRESLLRNEIRFEVSSIAVRLCDLNRWDSSHVQETTLQIALQDSPDQVFLSIEDVFLREVSVSTGTAPLGQSLRGSIHSVTSSPTPQRDSSTFQGSFSAFARCYDSRPLNAFQLYCRLLNVICNRFDHCPDDISARSTLRTLVVTGIRVATMLLEYCSSRFSYLCTTLDAPADGERLQAMLQRWIREERPLLPPPFAPPIVSSTASRNTEDTSNCREASELSLLDVHFLLCTMHALRECLLCVPEGSAIVMKAADLPWHPKAVTRGSLQSTAHHNASALLTAVSGATHAVSPSGAATLPVLPSSPILSWSVFSQHVGALLLGSCGVAAVLEAVVELTRGFPSSLSEVIRAACGVCANMCWKLSHLQRLAGLIAFERLANITASTEPNEKSSRLREADLIVKKVYGSRTAGAWWMQLYRRTSKQRLRDVVVQHNYVTLLAPLNDRAFRRATNVLTALQGIAGSFSSSGSAAPHSLSRIIVSRMLFSHGGFLSDATAISTVAPNTSFLLLPEDDDSDEAHNEDSDILVQRALAKTRANGSTTAATQRCEVEPTEIVDVAMPQMHPAESVSHSLLSILKPTQPLPYLDIAVEWIEWSQRSTRASHGSDDWTLLDDDDASDVWICVLMEHALFARRDAQAHVSQLRVGDDTVLAILRGLDGSLDADASEADSDYTGLPSVLRYCFRHHDLEAVGWIIDSFFAAATESTRGVDVISFITACHDGIRRTEAALLDVERMMPEKSLLVMLHRSFCSASRLLLDTSLTVFLQRSSDDVGDEECNCVVRQLQLFQPPSIDVFGQLQPQQQSCAFTGACFTLAVAAAKQSLLMLSESVPHVAVSIAVDLLRRCGPEAWATMSAASSDDDSDVAALLRAKRNTSAMLLFRAYECTLGHACTSMPSPDQDAAWIAEWLAKTSTALIALRGGEATVVVPDDASAGCSFSRSASSALQRGGGRMCSWYPLLPFCLVRLSRVSVPAGELMSYALALCALPENDLFRDAMHHIVKGAADAPLGSAAPTDGQVDPEKMRETLLDCAWATIGDKSLKARWESMQARDASTELMFHGRDVNRSSDALHVFAITDQALRCVSRPASGMDASNVQEVVSSLPTWTSIPPVVRGAENDDAVCIDVWSLLQDGRPITAYHQFTESKPTQQDCDVCVATARSIGFQQVVTNKRPRLDVMAAVAAFLRLIDAAECQRFLVDCNILLRVAGVSSTTGLHSSQGQSQVSAPLSSSETTARHLSLLTSASRQPLSLHQQSIVSTVLHELDIRTAAAAGVQSGSEVGGRLLAAHFVHNYRGAEAAREYVLHSIVKPQLQRGEWIWALLLTWATGFGVEDWVASPLSITEPVPTLRYLFHAPETCMLPPEGAFAGGDGNAARSLLQALMSDDSCVNTTHDAADAEQLRDDAMCRRCVHAVNRVRHPIEAVMELIACTTPSFTVARRASECIDFLSSEHHQASTHHGVEQLIELVMAVMRARCLVTASTAKSAVASLLHSDMVSEKPVLTRTAQLLQVHEDLLLCSFAGVSQSLDALRAADFDMESAREQLSEASELLLDTLYQTHVLPSSDAAHGSGDSDDDSHADSHHSGDDNGSDESYLHENIGNVIAIVLQSMSLCHHRHTQHALFLWLTFCIEVLDGRVAAASRRATSTAAAFIACRTVLDRFGAILSSSRSGNDSPMSSTEVMMLCLGQHPNLSVEGIQELALLVDQHGSHASQRSCAPGGGVSLVEAVKEVDEILFGCGLFTCAAERPSLIVAAMEHADSLVHSAQLVMQAVVHSTLSHILNEELTVSFCALFVSVATDSLAEKLSEGAREDCLSCGTFLRSIEEHNHHCNGGLVVPVACLRMLLGSLAVGDDVRTAQVAQESSPSIRAPLLPADVVAVVAPAARNRPALRSWLKRCFAVDISAACPEVLMVSGSPGRAGSVGSTAAHPIEDDPMGYIEDYVPSALVDEARAVHATRAHNRKQTISPEFRQKESSLLWRSTNAVLSRCMTQDGIHQIIPFLAAHPSDPFATQNVVHTLNSILRQAVFCVLRAHYVPLMLDISQRLFSREKQRFPTAQEDFEKKMTEFFFADEESKGANGECNLFGMGEASGWACRDRIRAITAMLEGLQPLADAHLATHAASECLSHCGSSSSSSLPSDLVTSFGRNIIHELNRFQSCVRLPSKSLYPRLFLDPLVLLSVHCYWILQHHYDDRLAADLAKELSCVMSVCLHDGDIEPMRKIIFAVGDVTLLSFVADSSPASQLVTLANSSPEFQLQPLHRSTMRVAIMSFFDRLAHGGTCDAFVRQTRVEMTTLYANFRHFTALGERLEHEAHHMLQGFVQQASTQKKGILDSQKDALKRQNRMLDEIDARFLSAANFFIQDGQFERCLTCIRDLHLINAQKKTSTMKLLGLTEDTALGIIATQLDSPQDVIGVAYGYNVTSTDDWAHILFKQVVHRGKKDVLSAYRAQTVSFSPAARKKLTELWRSDTSAQKDSAKKQLWTWMEEEVLRPVGASSK